MNVCPTQPRKQKLLTPLTSWRRKLIEWQSKYSHQCILEYLKILESRPIYMHPCEAPIAVSPLRSPGGALPALWPALALDCWLACESVRVLRSGWLMLRAWCARIEWKTLESIGSHDINIKQLEAHHRDYISHRSVNRYILHSWCLWRGTYLQSHWRKSPGHACRPPMWFSFLQHWMEPQNGNILNSQQSWHGFYKLG